GEPTGDVAARIEGLLADQRHRLRGRIGRVVPGVARRVRAGVEIPVRDDRLALEEGLVVPVLPGPSRGEIGSGEMGRVPVGGRHAGRKRAGAVPERGGGGGGRRAWGWRRRRAAPATSAATGGKRENAGKQHDETRGPRGR